MVQANTIDAGLGTKPVPRLALTMSVPTIVAQAANASYTIIDRLFIGHIPEVGNAAMTGVGICFPILLAVTAFASLIGAGGAPRASIELGRGNFKKAERILGTSAAFLIAIALTLTVLLQLAKRPILYAFGASDATIEYAVDFITIYLIGTVFVQLTLGLNNFISAQGKTTVAMVSVLIGTGISILLDPVFIFVFGWGVRGAAAANVLAQLVSTIWIVLFLSSGRSAIRLRPLNIRFDRIIIPVLALGLAPFIMQITESAISAVFSANLAKFGGDIYVTTMTVGTSINQIYFMVIQGFGQGAQPVTGYNYGAGRYDRVRQGFRFLAVVCLIYATVFWGLLQLFMPRIIGLFNSDAALLETAVPMLRIYFLLTFLFALQNASQSTFVALGEAKKATFFALFRKVLLLIPLIIVLPRLGFGVTGIFAAEPIADTLSAVICFMTFLLTSYRELKQKELAQQSLQRE